MANGCINGGVIVSGARLFFLDEVYPLVQAEDHKTNTEGHHVGNAFSGLFDFYDKLCVKEPRPMPRSGGFLEDVKKARIHLCWHEKLDGIPQVDLVWRLMGAFDRVNIHGVWAEWTTEGDFGVRGSNTKHLDRILNRAGSPLSRGECQEAKSSQESFAGNVLAR